MQYFLTGQPERQHLVLVDPDRVLNEELQIASENNEIDVCFHYYDNNWHYVRRWQHLKDVKSLYPLSKEVKNSIENLQNKKFQQSDHYIARNISCLIKLSWTEEEVKLRADKMVSSIKEAISK